MYALKQIQNFSNKIKEVSKQFLAAGRSLWKGAGIVDRFPDEFAITMRQSGTSPTINSPTPTESSSNIMAQLYRSNAKDLQTRTNNSIHFQPAQVSYELQKLSNTGLVKPQEAFIQNFGISSATGVLFAIGLGLHPSSNIQSATYFPEDDRLLVTFKSGSLYTYTKVPISIIERWLEAPSTGSFHYHNIRMNFPYYKG